MRNRLRDRIVVQVDGQLKTGRDVLIAALLGAEEYGFATAPLVVSGCVMMRVCHLDTCPVGIATQNPELRKRFTGRPEFVVNFFEYIAEEVRELLGALGFRSLDEIIGHPELIDLTSAVGHWKAHGLDLTPILVAPEAEPDAARHCVRAQDHGLDRALDRTLIEACRPALDDAVPVQISMPIRNGNRTVGTLLGAEVTRRYGGAGLPGRHHRHLLHRLGRAELRRLRAARHHPAAGRRRQRLPRARACPGAGWSSGPRPPAPAGFVAEEQIIAGNVILYGATGGEAFIRGVVGERFAVRNSGAVAVVEGVGDHGCEYMTGGRVVVLGSTGRNFGAGMSGGVAFVWDPDGSFPALLNPEMVDLEECDEEDVTWLEQLLDPAPGRDRVRGGDPRSWPAWPRSALRFTKVMPRDYKRVVEAMRAADAAGVAAEQAIMAAAHG